MSTVFEAATLEVDFICCLSSGDMEVLVDSEFRVCQSFLRCSFGIAGESSHAIVGFVNLRRPIGRNTRSHIIKPLAIPHLS